MPICNVCLPNWFHLQCPFTKTALVGFTCIHSIMERQSKKIRKCLFAMCACKTDFILNVFSQRLHIGFSCKHSLMQRQSKDIGKCLFAKIIKKCMQETPYNFPIKVSLLCIILPTKHKSGYGISLFFHPKVSFQCIIMPSTTKESLQYIYILYTKRVLVLSQQLIQKE